MSVAITIPVASATASNTKSPQPASSAGASSAPTTLTAAQLAKETVSQLQTLANKGNQAAMRELKRREAPKSEHSGQTEGATGGAPETEGTQEPGKGSQLDKTA